MKHIWLVFHDFGYGSTVEAFTSRKLAQNHMRSIRADHVKDGTWPKDLYLQKVEVQNG